MIADLNRIKKRIPRLLLIAVTVIIIVIIEALVIGISKDPLPGDTFNSGLKGGMGCCACLFGLYEINFVYGDAFKAKTIQKAIGNGISRPKLICAAWLETILLLAIDLLIATVFCSLVGFIGAPGYGIRHIAALLVYDFGSWFQIAAAAAVASIFFFANQSIGVGVLVYLAVSLGLISVLVRYGGALLKLEKLHLESYELNQAANVFIARLELGSIHLQSMVIVLLYIILSYIVTVGLFGKRELDF